MSRWEKIVEEFEQLSEEDKKAYRKERLAHLRGSTKAGGYEEVPEELIEEQARRIGLEEEEIPEVVVVEDAEFAEVVRLESDDIRVVIPRRQRKKSIPRTLRHEFAHIKLGHVGYGEEISLEEHVRRELEARKFEFGRLTSDFLEDQVLTLVMEEEVPKRLATKIVMDAGEELGASRVSVTTAKRWLRSYWRVMGV